jgi:sulfonate transport system substrate-binding protein
MHHNMLHRHDAAPKTARWRRMASLCTAATALSATLLALPALPASATVKQSQVTRAQVARADLAGVTINVGDQLDVLQSLLTASGEANNLPYRLDWHEFPGASGPQLVAAESGGSIDLAYLGDTPLIFAQAAGDDLKVIGASEVVDPATHSPDGIVVPASSPITKVSQLKGKQVALTVGTVFQYVAIQILKTGGLSYSDVTPVNLSLADGMAALQKGSVAAWVTTDPYISLLTSGGKFRLLRNAAGVYNSPSFLVTPAQDLTQTSMQLALGDLVSRVALAGQWAKAHPDQWAAVEAQGGFKGLPVSLIEETLTRAQSAFVPIDGSLVKQQQAQAATFLAQHQLSTPVKVDSEFDGRFNSLVAQALHTESPSSAPATATSPTTSTSQP